MPILNRLWEHLYAYQGATKQRLTQAELAKRVGISYPTLLRYLNNTCANYDPQGMEKFCEILQFPIEAFFYVADEAPTKVERAGRRRTTKS
jgi:transcriptional regulator with XRE-family HTH domain